jgi:hypothetical protein
VSEARRGTVVEVKPVRDPLNRPSVLIQLEDGYVVLLPDDAWRVVSAIMTAAWEAEHMESS